jgi:hypothetical protein
MWCQLKLRFLTFRSRDSPACPTILQCAIPTAPHGSADIAIEGFGVQLFARIEGCRSANVGLLLAELR